MQVRAVLSSSRDGSLPAGGSRMIDANARVRHALAHDARARDGDRSESFVRAHCGPGRGKWLYFYHLYGNLNAMKATLDAAGRIVVPKALRQALGLKAGQPLEIRAGDGRLEIEIAPTPVQLKRRGKGVVAVPDVELPALTAEQVRDTLERVRR